MTTDTPNPFARYVDASRPQIAMAILTALPDMEDWRRTCWAEGRIEIREIAEAFLAALAIVGPEIRRDAFDEAAEECERQKEIFASPQYATGQPLSSLHERVACNTCAAAIRALGKEG